MKIDDSFVKKAKKIRLVVTDVDGTLTDGSVYVSEAGDISKKFSFKDIMAINLLKKNNINIAIISGEKTKIIDTYALKLKLEHVYQGISDKRECLLHLIAKLSIDLNNVAFIGDDINDLDVIKIVGLPITVGNSNYKLLEVPGVYSTENIGGQGALRELVDTILLAVSQ